jgi:hypothetical protein
MQLLAGPSRRRPLVAVLLLVALAATTLGASVHTDDGCAVERHCRACRLALASAGAAPPELPQLAPGDGLEPARHEAETPLHDAAVDTLPGRGPPAAL